MTNDEFVIDNIKLAYKIAREYYKKFNCKVEYEDLQSISYIGLVKAAQKYDYKLGYAFSTYAYRTMKNEILTHYKKNLIQQDISLNKPIGQDIELQDVISDSDYETHNIDRIINKSIIRDGIDSLDDFHRRIVELYLLGYKRKEIAIKLNCDINVVNNEYANAIKILRRRIDK